MRSLLPVNEYFSTTINAESVDSEQALTSRWRESARDVSRRALALMDLGLKSLKPLDPSLCSGHVSGGDACFAPETN